MATDHFEVPYILWRIGVDPSEVTTSSEITRRAEYMTSFDEVYNPIMEKRLPQKAQDINLKDLKDGDIVVVINDMYNKKINKLGIYKGEYLSLHKVLLFNSSKNEITFAFSVLKLDNLSHHGHI